MPLLSAVQSDSNHTQIISAFPQTPILIKTGASRRISGRKISIIISHSEQGSSANKMFNSNISAVLHNPEINVKCIYWFCSWRVTVVVPTEDAVRKNKLTKENTAGICIYLHFWKSALQTWDNAGRLLIAPYSKRYHWHKSGWKWSYLTHTAAQLCHGLVTLQKSTVLQRKAPAQLKIQV